MLHRLVVDDHECTKSECSIRVSQTPRQTVVNRAIRPPEVIRAQSPTQRRILLSMRVWLVVAATIGLLVSASPIALAARGTNASLLLCGQQISGNLTSHTPATRLVLGRVWLPKSSILLGRNRWRLPIPPGQDAFVKFGITVTAGSPVTLEVPSASRAAYALHFSSSATTVAGGETDVRVFPCPRSQTPWTAWAGGYLVKRPACVPLLVHVGTRTARVKIALGHSC